MMQRTPSLAFHSQQSLSYGTPTQQLSSEQEQPFVPYTQEEYHSFGGGSQVHAQSWLHGASSASRQLQEPRGQACSPAHAAPQSHAQPAAPSASFLHLPTTTATNGRTKLGYDSMAPLPLYGRALTLLNEKETDAEKGLTLQSQMHQRRQYQEQQQPQSRVESHGQHPRFQQQQQQQTNLEPQHKDAVSQGAPVLHPSIPSYLRPYISNKPIVSQSALDRGQGQPESYSSMTSNLFSQSREIRTLLDKITMLDGALDGFDRQMVDHQKRLTDVMVTKDDALSMFESKAGEKVAETLQRQGTDVLAQLKEQTGKAQEMQGRHLEEWRKDLLSELGKMTSLWQQQIGKLQEVQGEWKGELWRWKTQIQEELASEMNALRAAIALQSHMLTMLSEQNRRILKERLQDDTRNSIPQNSCTPGESTLTGVWHNAQGQEPTLASNPGIGTICLPHPTEKGTTAKESISSAQGRGRGRGRPRGSGHAKDLSQGNVRRGRGRPPGKARRALLEVQLASGIDPSGKRQKHPSGTLQHNPPKEQDVAIESEQPPGSTTLRKSNSEVQQQRTEADTLPRGVVLDEFSVLGTDLSFNFPVLTRSKRREYDLGAPFLDLDHHERPRHANKVG